ncbi:hypothetical protein ACWDO7_04080 [Streptomyces sp. NPDC003656]
MNPETIANAAATVVTSLGTFLGIASRRKRLRGEIRENLTLSEELEKNSLLRDQTPAVVWLNAKIALDVAKLSGQQLGTPKKPIKWGSATLTLLVAAAFGYWAYWLNRDDFVWYSVFPGTVSLLMLFSTYGQFLNREILPEGESGGQIPEGAVPVGAQGAPEEISRGLLLGVTGADDRHEADGQIGVAFRFVEHIKSANFNEALELSDDNWILCRIQTWLWNNRASFGDDVSQLGNLADAMMASRVDHALWNDFEASEIATFLDSWGYIDPEALGGASRRRRVGRNYDVVILAPIGSSGGYYVDSPTPVPGALTFLMHRHEESWVLASHVAAAPPSPGFPPSWWVVGDPSVEDLPG